MLDNEASLCLKDMVRGQKVWHRCTELNAAYHAERLPSGLHKGADFVLGNPPFGTWHKGADVAFLTAALQVCTAFGSADTRWFA